MEVAEAEPYLFLPEVAAEEVGPVFLRVGVEVVHPLVLVMEEERMVAVQPQLAEREQVAEASERLLLHSSLLQVTPVI